MFGGTGTGLEAGESSKDLAASVVPGEWGEGLVESSLAHARLVAHHQSRFYADIIGLLAVFTGDRDLVAAEIAAAHRLTRRAAEAEVDLAMDLARFPDVHGALDQGRIGLREVRVIIEGVRALADDTAVDLVSRILPEAPRLTTGQLRSRIHKLRLELTPREAAEERKAGLAERGFVVDANPDGTANVHLLKIDPSVAMGIRDRVGYLARRAKTAHDPRTADQIRADVASDLLLRSDGAGRRATVHLLVDLATLAELARDPAHIPGYGPVAAEIARKIAESQADCDWEYIFRENGKVVSTGTVRRRPTRAMKRTIRAHYPTCVWPGCRMPAADSDLDHMVPWSEGGATALRNLGPLCRYHHMMREKGWSYERLPDGGHRFTSPLGRVYVTGADPPPM